MSKVTAAKKVTKSALKAFTKWSKKVLLSKTNKTQGEITGKKFFDIKAWKPEFTKSPLKAATEAEKKALSTKGKAFLGDIEEQALKSGSKNFQKVNAEVARAESLGR